MSSQKQPTQIRIEGLHPTFGAAIHGVDFSQKVSDEVFAEVLAAITKVRFQLYLGSRFQLRYTVWYLCISGRRSR